MMTFIYNPTLNHDRLSCRFVCSHDLFNETTVGNIAQRFQHLIFQLFSLNHSIVKIDHCMTSINKLSLILPEEREEMQGTIFSRLSNIVNEGMFICNSFHFFYLSHLHRYETL